MAHYDLLILDDFPQPRPLRFIIDRVVEGIGVIIPNPAYQPPPLPRGEWEERFVETLFIYNPTPHNLDETFIFIDIDGKVSINDDFIISPALHELEPRNETDPDRQPLIMMDENTFLLL